ncbi:hypothetical protein ANAEL_05426 [Anaerolineales bacterium]|nr:hypothetical protein ANAEL_05426 [Anaerolineales bacterium]
MAYVIIFAVPIIISVLLGNLPTGLRKVWVFAGFGLMATMLDVIFIILRHYRFPPYFMTQIILFAALPSLLLALAAILLNKMQRLNMIFGLGPLVYWIGDAIGIGLWLMLGFPL